MPFWKRQADTGCDINIDDGVLELTGEEAEIEAALDAIRELVSVVSAQPLVTAKVPLPPDRGYFDGCPG